MRRKDPIYFIHFHQTEVFRNWLKKRNLEWPSSIVKQDRLINLAIREGLEEEIRRRAQEIDQLAEEAAVRAELEEEIRRRAQEIDRLAKEAAPLLLCSEEVIRRALEQALTAPLTKDVLERIRTQQETGS